MSPPTLAIGSHGAGYVTRYFFQRRRTKHPPGRPSPFFSAAFRGDSELRGPAKGRIAANLCARVAASGALSSSTSPSNLHPPPELSAPRARGIAAQNTALNAALHAALNAALDAALNAARDAVLNTALNAALNVALNAALNAGLNAAPSVTLRSARAPNTRKR